MHERVAGANTLHNGWLSLRFAGGWSAWDQRSPPDPDELGRRTPAGVRQVLSSGAGARLAAVSPAGTVAYTLGEQYYLALADGSLRALGPVGAGETVVWRGTRFVLFAGGSAYALAP